MTYNIADYKNHITKIYNANTYIISELARQGITLPKVTYLSICGICEISALDYFESMEIWDCEDNESILPNLKNLTVDLEGYYCEVTSLHFRRHNKLKSITIFSNTVIDCFFFNSCENITELFLYLDVPFYKKDSVWDGEIGDTKYILVGLEGELTNLKNLFIEIRKNILVDSILEFIGAIKSLNYLSLMYYPSIENNNLSFLKDLTNLKSLSLRVFSPLDNSKIQMPSDEELKFIKEKNIVIHKNCQ